MRCVLITVRQLQVPCSYAPLQKGLLTLCCFCQKRKWKGWLDGFPGQWFMFSKMQSGCLVEPLIFHSFYLCLAHEVATYKKPVPTLHAVPCWYSNTPFTTNLLSEKRFQYRSTEQENYWAIVRLEVDSYKVVCFCLFVWHQNWFSDFYFLEKIWLWKHRKTSIHVKIFRVEQRWTDMFRIIVCLRSSQQLLCRQKCIEICV